MTDSINSTYFSNNFTLREGTKAAKRNFDTFEDRRGVWLLDVEGYYLHTAKTLEDADDPEELGIVTLHKMDGSGGFLGEAQVTMFSSNWEASTYAEDLYKKYNLKPSGEFHRCGECRVRLHKSEFGYIGKNKVVFVCKGCIEAHNSVSQEV